MGQRINFIDYAKAIGIFLVVLAHTPLKSEITDWIYVFHMPLFFFLSGYLFDIKRYPTFNGFMVRRFHQLVIPYFFINLFTYFLWLFVFRHYGAESEIAITWYQPINYIGRNTLLICGFHLMVFSLIKGILLFGFHFNLQSLEQAIIGNVLFAVVAILLCCLLISTYHKGKVLIDHVRNK